VASKLVDAFHRPAVVISIEDGIGHGSCRSIGAFDMLGAIEACGSHLQRFGGHKMAAGLTLDAAALKPFRAALQAHGDDRLAPDDLRPRLRIDGRLDLDAIKGRLVEELQALEPFGMGNPKPVFWAGPVEIVDGPRRLKERHLKMGLRQRGRIFRAIAWRAAEREPFLVENRAAVDVAFSLTQNTFNGETHTELTLSDARVPADGAAVAPAPASQGVALA
jgi:single-stranded-DNA-specific exonuclease